jgi:germination protein M
MRSRGRIVVLVLLCVAVAFVAAAAAGRSAHRTAQSSLAVYLVRGEKVTPARRLVPQTSALAHRSLVALLRGPTSAERRLGYATMIPSRTVLRNLALAHGLLTVDLSRRFEAGGGSLSMQLRVAQIVFTATQFSSVKRVAFRLDGRPVDAIGGEGMMVKPPVGRATFEAQVPPILVEQPLPGDTVNTPLLVRGSANVFEAQLAVDVKRPSGKLLAHRSVHASAGTGTRGPFAVRIPLSGVTGKVVALAYSHSAKTGAPINVVRVPITLGAGARAAARTAAHPPTVQVVRATVDRASRTVDLQLRICFSAGPRAQVTISERRTYRGTVMTRSWVPSGEIPNRISPFACRAGWRVNWLLAPRLRGPGSYQTTIRVRDAYGRWSEPAGVSLTSP